MPFKFMFCSQLLHKYSIVSSHIMHCLDNSGLNLFYRPLGEGLIFLKHRPLDIFLQSTCHIRFSPFSTIIFFTNVLKDGQLNFYRFENEIKEIFNIEKKRNLEWKYVSNVSRCNAMRQIMKYYSSLNR